MMTVAQKSGPFGGGYGIMKKHRYYWPCLLPISLYFLYYIANVTILVEIFGCGCLKYREPPRNVNMLGNQFNANDFTRLFWLLVALILVIVSFVISRKIEDQEKRAVYLKYSVIIAVGLSCFCLLASPMWK